jgi:hypothetical protein
MVFIPQPGISGGTFQLRMGNFRFCKLLLLFKISTKTDAGMQQHECAYVSVLEEYSGLRKPGQTISFIEISLEAGILLGGKHEACFVLGVAGIEPMPS